MLILTRWLDESIIIGDNIHVKVLGIQGRQIRLGIDAPREISVFREELLEEKTRIKEEESAEPA